jgi:hypothetical protein
MEVFLAEVCLYALYVAANVGTQNLPPSPEYTTSATPQNVVLILVHEPNPLPQPLPRPRIE